MALVNREIGRLNCNKERRIERERKRERDNSKEKDRDFEGFKAGTRCRRERLCIYVWEWGCVGVKERESVRKALNAQDQSAGLRC